MGAGTLLIRFVKENWLAASIAGMTILLTNLACLYFIFKQIMPRQWHWSRFHLSTGIVLMFAGGGLILANLSPAEYRFPNYMKPPSSLKVKEYGWPMPCVYIGNKNYSEGSNGFVWSDDHVVEVKRIGWAVNIAAATAVLAVTAMIFEWIYFYLQPGTAAQMGIPIQRKDS